MKLGILRDLYDNYLYYVYACNDLGIENKVVDIMSEKWIDEIRTSDCAGFLAAPYCTKEVWKTMYQERLYIINKVMGYPIYPSYNELFLYESKRNMTYWLKLHSIPMPKTWVFYDKNEAMQFINEYDSYPIVFKPNIGSSALGLKIIKNRKEARKIVNRVFSKWHFFSRGYTKWYKTKYKISIPVIDDKQYNNILFQEKINVRHEWRGVRIGESYFAHKKLAGRNGLHSGSGLASYDNPPLAVLDFIKYVCDVSGFRSMDVDFFEDTDGNFYVNELQAFFGSRIKPYQMCVDGKPGRYRYINDEWVFEEGMFNQNNSCSLRVEDFIKQLHYK